MMKNKGEVFGRLQVRRSQVANACISLAMMMAAGAVHSGAGWGDSSGPDGSPIRQATFYAHSPSGYRDNTPIDNTFNPDPRRNNNYTGKALRKFVDALPGVGTKTTLSDGTEKIIPQAQTTKWVKPSGDASLDDYLEIAVIQYREKLHSDLVKPSVLRGYVQIDQFATHGLAAPVGWMSKQVPLFYDGTANPIMIQRVDVNGLLQWNNDGTPSMVQAKAVDNPHYLGPAIVATKGIATRLKFYNLLPVGRYNSAVGNQGDLFIPVDETLPGAGVGPDGVTRYTQNRANIHLHGGDTPWISDGTPHQWIAPAGERDNITAEMQAAGSPTQADANQRGVDEFLRGASAANVPDMNDPGAGASTYYFPNLQSGRMMWYHDHTFGLTRLNVYTGQAAPYVLIDKVQEDLLKKIPNFPDDKSTLALVIQDKTFVPDDIALQDGRWNVGVDGAKYDGVNAKPIWGQPGDLWYPHVYEVNQDPNNGEDGTNPVGRWDWGPYFWPVFPSLYNLPTGAVGDVTLTPEAWMDTPMVNGVAYPTMTVDPKPYRLKILNASNDRFWNLSMFVADTQVSTIKVTDGGAGYDPATTTVTMVNKPNAGGTGATADAVVVNGVVTAIRVTNAGTGYTKAPNIFIVDGKGNKTASAEATLAVNTEVKMVPAVPASATGMAACQMANGADIAPPYAPPCWPSNWPTDGRDGGVPDPSTAGPMFYQIGNEGGLLPQVAEIAAAPVQYEYNRRSVTVLNTLTNGLYLGNAERADVLVDFSKFAGQTLIVYNDSPAPVPAFDPRNDHWTGKPDESGAGSVETPRAGFGPNTRTVMQIKVSDGSPSTPLSVVDLKAKLPEIYGATQERPVVAQEQYNPAFNAAWSNAPQADGTKAFATIFTGSLQEPAFKYTPGVPNGTFKIKVNQGGSGYTTPPLVTITSTDPVAPVVTATAKATLRISAVTVVNAGKGYLYAPTVTFTNTSAGTGAAAVAWLKVNAATGLVGTGNYQLSTGAKSFRLMFSEPQSSGYDAAGKPLTGAASAAWKAANTAYGTATVGANGAITGFTVDFAGHGYNRSPLLSPIPLDASNNPIAPALGTTYAYASPAVVDCSIDTIMLTSTDPNHPEFAGGVGYDNLANVTVNMTAPTGPVAQAASVTITGAVTDVTLTNAGQGYVNTPAISIAAPAVGTTATATATIGGSSLLVKNKAIQELFDPTYGRMNATLGIEIPFTSALTQTTIPLGYVDPATEEFSDGETQVWKITHNGVDTHPVHFHLLNVQLINRVGWDGTIKKPNANEYGWKETIKMNPLEDILVAVRAKKPQLAGFGLPNSSRRRDPSQPANVPTGFTQVDVVTGNPATVVNTTDDYGWEYVWHCHILGHEENDFMRPVKFNANEAIPTPPTNVVSGPIVNNQVTISWTDTSSTEYQFRIERTALDAFSNKLAIANNTPGYALANSQFYVDTLPALPANTASLQYRVVAVGASGESSAAAAPGQVVPAPTGVAAVMANSGAITVSWNGTASNQVNQYLIQASLNGGAFIDLNTQAKVAGVNSYVFTPVAVTAGDSYIFRVVSQNAGANTTSSSPSATQAPVVYTAPGAATAVVTSMGANGVVSLSWTAPAGTVTNYLVQPLLNGQPVNGAASTVTTTSTTYTPSNVAAGQVYTFQVTAQRVIGGSTLQSAVATSGNVTYGGPSAVTATGSTTSMNAATGAISLSWSGAANATQYAVQPLLNGVATGAALTVVGATSTVFTPAAITAGDVYTFAVTAQEVINGTTLSSTATALNGSATYSAAVAPAGFSATLPTGTGLTFNLAWTVSANATNYSIQALLNGNPVTPAVTKVVAGNSTSTTLAVPATAGTWTFQIVALRNYTSVGTLTSAASTSAPTVFAAPGTPVLNGTLLALTSSGMSSTATVKWNAPSPVAVPGVSGYNVAIADANNASYTGGVYTGNQYVITVPRYKGVMNATGAVSLLPAGQVPVSGAIPATGTAVVYQKGAGTGITGLTNGNTYYVINLGAGSTSIKLASSATNASNGNALTLLGGSNTNGFGYGGLNSFTAAVTATNAVGTGSALTTPTAITAP